MLSSKSIQCNASKRAPTVKDFHYKTEGTQKVSSCFATFQVNLLGMLNPLVFSMTSHFGFGSEEKKLNHSLSRSCRSSARCPCWRCWPSPWSSCRWAACGDSFQGWWPDASSATYASQSECAKLKPKIITQNLSQLKQTFGLLAEGGGGNSRVVWSASNLDFFQN